MREWIWVLTTIAMLMLRPVSPSCAQERFSYSVSMGAFDVGNGGSAGELGLEIRFPPARTWGSTKYGLVPTLGAAGTEDGAAYAYGGARFDIHAGRRWLLSPHVALAAYEKGDGKDLGGLIEFRSGLEVALRLTEGHLLGINFYHLSNAGIYPHNPGSNSLVLAYSYSR